MVFVEEIRNGVMLAKCSSCGEKFEVEAKKLRDFIEKNQKCVCGHEFDFAEIEENAEECMPIYDSAGEDEKHEHYKNYIRSSFCRERIKLKD